MQAEHRKITPIYPKSMDVSEVKIRYAPYCRVSTDSSDQEHSFAAQVKYYAELISKLENAELADIYADEGISGRGKAKREDFNRLISDCKKGKIDRVITKSVSRFARNTVDCLDTVRLLAGYGVSVLFEKEGIDTATMSTEALLAMSGMQAQDESVSHGRNMKWSYQTRMKSGDFLGNCPAFGYSIINCSEHTVNAEEAKTVCLIKDLYLQGMGKQAIADYLNKSGISNRGKKWYAFTIDYILNNERYIGNALLQKKITTPEWPPRKVRNDGSQPQYYVENAIPALWTMDEWNAIQELQANKRNDHVKTGGHQLSKMLVCHECGHNYRRLKQREGYVWRCSYATSGKSNCKLYKVREDDIQSIFIRCVNTLYTHRDEILTPLIGQMEALQSLANGTQLKIYEIDKQIAVLSKQSLVIAELLSSGILEAADFSAQSNELGRQISSLRSKRREQLLQNENSDLLASLHELAYIFEDMGAEITEYDEKLIRSIIVKAEILSDTELCIHIKGGITVPERLPEHRNRRCK